MADRLSRPISIRGVSVATFSSSVSTLRTCCISLLCTLSRSSPADRWPVAAATEAGLGTSSSSSSSVGCGRLIRTSSSRAIFSLALCPAASAILMARCALCWASAVRPSAFSRRACSRMLLNRPPLSVGSCMKKASASRDAVSACGSRPVATRLSACQYFAELLYSGPAESLEARPQACSAYCIALPAEVLPPWPSESRMMFTWTICTRAAISRSIRLSFSLAIRSISAADFSASGMFFVIRKREQITSRDSTWSLMEALFLWATSRRLAAACSAASLWLVAMCSSTT
mmetsp:Transcript_112969/g.269252  ORF Transcript_112969/g.269252 Transcript_112969/m.269252 type:complete len:288 (+) Transcript_112969:142-1005(+)